MKPYKSFKEKENTKKPGRPQSSSSVSYFPLAEVEGKEAHHALKTMRNDILGPDKVIEDMLEISRPSGEPKERSEIDKEYSYPEDGVYEDVGQYQKEMNDEEYLLTWNRKHVKLWKKESGENQMKSVQENYEEDGEINSVSGQLLHGEGLSHEALESISHFLTKGKTYSNIKEMIDSVVSQHDDFDEAVDALKEMIDTQGVEEYSDGIENDTFGLNSFRDSIRNSLIHTGSEVSDDIIITEPREIQDEPGQPGVTMTPRTKPPHEQPQELRKNNVQIGEVPAVPAQQPGDLGAPSEEMVVAMNDDEPIEEEMDMELSGEVNTDQTVVEPNSLEAEEAQERMELQQQIRDAENAIHRKTKREQNIIKKAKDQLAKMSEGILNEQEDGMDLDLGGDEEPVVSDDEPEQNVEMNPGAEDPDLPSEDDWTKSESGGMLMAADPSAIGGALAAMKDDNPDLYRKTIVNYITEKGHKSIGEYLSKSVGSGDVGSTSPDGAPVVGGSDVSPQEDEDSTEGKILNQF